MCGKAGRVYGTGVVVAGRRSIDEIVGFSFFGRYDMSSKNGFNSASDVLLRIGFPRFILEMKMRPKPTVRSALRGR